MSFGLSAAAIGGLAAGAGAIGSAVIGSRAAGKAGAANAAAAADSTRVTQQQYDNLTALLDPYVRAGTGGNAFDGAAYLSANPDVAADPYYSSHPEEHYRMHGQYEGRTNPTAPGGPTGSLTAQQDLLGLNGYDAQQAAVGGIQNGAQFQAQLAAGENSIRQNASATGGLRGGNVQSALALYSPTLLAQTLQQQYGNLAGLTNMAQNSAAGVGSAGMQTASALTGINSQLGASNAGVALAQGKAINSGISGLLGAYGQYSGMKGF